MIRNKNLKDQYSLTALGAFTGACILFGCSWLIPNKVARVVALSGGLANVALASASLSRKEWFDNEQSDLSDIESNAIKQRATLDQHDFTVLGSEEVEESSVVEPKEYRTIQPQELKDNSVHLAIFASSGSGKSMFLKFLLSEIFTGESYVLIDPHSEQGSGLVIESKEHALSLLEDFSYGRLKRLIVGSGRDWESIFYFYSAIEDHLSFRFQNGGESANWPQLSIICEELPAIIKNLDTFEKDLVASTNQSLLAESRKVGLRLLILTQADQVKGLGLAGMSSLKSAYMFIRLGTDAVKYARQRKLFSLEEKLKEDIATSFANHKASGSKNLFKGYCAMVNDDYYLDYLDLRNWSGFPIKSDLVSESILEAVEVSDPNPVEDPITPEAIAESAFPRSRVVPKPSPDFPSYQSRYGISNGVNAPAERADGAKKVRVEVEDFWLAKFKEIDAVANLSQNKPAWIKDDHVSRYINARNEGVSSSVITKKMFTGGKYQPSKKWFEFTYGIVVSEGN